MSDPIRSFVIEGEKISVPAVQGDKLLEKFPDAKEFVSFQLDKDTVDIPKGQADMFMMKFKDASPLPGYDFKATTVENSAPVAPEMVPQADMTQVQPDTAEPQPIQEGDGFWSKAGNAALGTLSGIIGQGVMKLPKMIEDLSELPTKMMMNHFIQKEGEAKGISQESLDQMKRATENISLDPRGIAAKGLAESEPAKWFTENAKMLESKSQVSDKSIIDLAKNGDYKTALTKVGVEISRSLPYTLTALGGGTPGLVAMGLTTASKEYDDIKESDSSQAAKLTDAILNGTAEALGEYVGTQQIGKVLAGSFKSLGAQQAAANIKNAMESYMSQVLKKYGLLAIPTAEGVSEWATTIAQNAAAKYTGVDPNRNLMDGTGDSFIIGFAQGGAMHTGGTVLAKGYNKLVGDRPQIAQVNPSQAPEATAPSINIGTAAKPDIVGVVTQEDGTKQLDKQFESEAEATKNLELIKGRIKQAEEYDFTVSPVDMSDPNDEFKSEVFIVSYKRKEQGQQIEQEITPATEPVVENKPTEVINENITPVGNAETAPVSESEAIVPPAEEEVKKPVAEPTEKASEDVPDVALPATKIGKEGTVPTEEELTTAEGITNTFSDMGEGMKKASLLQVIDQLGKGDVIFKNAEAIKAAKENENYKTEVLPDGSLKIVDVKNPDTGKWVRDSQIANMQSEEGLLDLAIKYGAVAPDKADYYKQRPGKLIDNLDRTPELFYGNVTPEQKAELQAVHASLISGKPTTSSPKGTQIEKQESVEVPLGKKEGSRIPTPLEIEQIALGFAEKDAKEATDYLNVPNQLILGSQVKFNQKKLADAEQRIRKHKAKIKSLSGATEQKAVPKPVSVLYNYKGKDVVSEKEIKTNPNYLYVEYSDGTTEVVEKTKLPIKIEGATPLPKGEVEATDKELNAISPKGVKDVYTAGRKIFGLNKVQSLAQAIIVDRIVARMAKNKGISKLKAYEGIEFRKVDKAMADQVTDKQVQDNKGAMMMVDGKAVVMALTDPNLSTPLHEIAHVYERYMTVAERKSVLAWTGDKTWNVQTSEKFARGFEKYLADGVSPNKALEAVFKRLKEWMSEIYNGIKGSAIEITLSPNMQNLYDSILTGKKYVPLESVEATVGVGKPKSTSEALDDLFGSLSFQSSPLFQAIGEKGAIGIEGLVDKLTDAKQKTEEGVDAKTIFLATGWEKFPDGWRYDLPDVQLTDEFKNFDKINTPFWLKDAIDDKTGLLKAYPELREVIVVFDNSTAHRGSWNKESGIIYLSKKLLSQYTDNPTESVRSTLLHEVQHVIQSLEGFARGGNMEIGLQALQDEIRGTLSSNPEFQRLEQEATPPKGWFKGWTTTSEEKVAKAKRAMNKMLLVEAQKMLKAGSIDELKYEAYRRIAGEVEARNVQERLTLSPEKRKESMLSETQDVVEEQKIYIQKAIKGEALSIEKPSETVTVDGVERSTVNSQGQQIHPTKEGVVNFWKWFGDSSVKTEDGKPIAVYHGTPKKGFDEFGINEGSKSKSKMQLLFGSHFAESRKDAELYIKNKGGVYEVYLSLKNPLNLSDAVINKGDKNFDNALRVIKELKFDKNFKTALDYTIFTEKGNYGGKSNDIQRLFLTAHMLDSVNPQKVFSVLKANNFDGVIYTPYQPVGLNGYTNFSKSYIAFNPTQIKSSTENTGTFSPNENSILFQSNEDQITKALNQAIDISEANADKDVAKEVRDGIAKTNEKRKANGQDPLPFTEAQIEKVLSDRGYGKAKKVSSTNTVDEDLKGMVDTAMNERMKAAVEQGIRTQAEYDKFIKDGFGSYTPRSQSDAQDMADVMFEALGSSPKEKIDNAMQLVQKEKMNPDVAIALLVRASAEVESLQAKAKNPATIEYYVKKNIEILGVAESEGTNYGRGISYFNSESVKAHWGYREYLRDTERLTKEAQDDFFAKNIQGRVENGKFVPELDKNGNLILKGDLKKLSDALDIKKMIKEARPVVTTSPKYTEVRDKVTKSEPKDKTEKVKVKTLFSEWKSLVDTKKSGILFQGGAKLSEKDFYSSYWQHQMTRDNSESDLQGILKDGFHPQHIEGFNAPKKPFQSKFSLRPNLMPAKKGTEQGVQGKYPNQKGKIILFVPKSGMVEGGNGMFVKPGWKPQPYEIGVVEYDNQPSYEIYSKAFSPNGILFQGEERTEKQILSEIIGAYIRMGVYKTQDIIDKVKAEVKANIGLNISDEAIVGAIPTEVGGMPFDEWQEDEEEKKAAEVLAQRLKALASEKKPDNDPLHIMIRTLVSKASEKMSQGEKKGKTDLEIIAIAIQNRDAWMDVWNEAKGIAFDKIDKSKVDDSVKDAMKAKIEEAYKLATKAPFSEALLDRTIKETAEELGIRIDRIVHSSITERTLIKGQLQKALVDKAGLSGTDAQALEDAVKEALDNFITVKSAKEVDKYITKQDKFKPYPLGKIVQLLKEETAKFKRKFPEAKNPFEYMREEVKRLAKEKLQSDPVTQALYTDAKIDKMTEFNLVAAAFTDPTEVQDLVNKLSADMRGKIANEEFLKDFPSEEKAKIEFMATYLLAESEKRTSQDEDVIIRSRAVSEMIGMVRAGAFENENFLRAFAIAKGIAPPTPTQVAEVKRLHDVMKKEKSEIIKKERELELTAYIANFTKPDIASIVQVQIVTGMLAGIGTMTYNATVGFLASQAMRAIQGASSLYHLDFNRLALVHNAWGKTSFRENWIRAKGVLQSGFAHETSVLDVPTMIERARTDSKILNFMIAHSKYVIRAMMTPDNFNVGMLEEGLIQLRMYDEAHKDWRNTGAQSKKDWIKNYLYADLGITPDSKRDIKRELDIIIDEASKEVDPITGQPAPRYYSERQQQLMLRELVDKHRAAVNKNIRTWQQDAHRNATWFTGNAEFMGTIGNAAKMFTDVVKTFAKGHTKGVGIAMMPVTFITLFLRIMTVVAEVSLNANPFVGWARYKTGRYGLFLDKDNKQRVTLNEYDRGIIRKQINFSLGVMAAATAILLSGVGGDDDDPWFSITGGGGGILLPDPIAAAQRGKTHEYQAFSLKFGPVHIPYIAIPGVSAALIPLGNLMDVWRFGTTKVTTVEEDENGKKRAVTKEVLNRIRYRDQKLEWFAKGLIPATLAVPIFVSTQSVLPVAQDFSDALVGASVKALTKAQDMVQNTTTIDDGSVPDGSWDMNDFMKDVVVKAVKYSNIKNAVAPAYVRDIYGSWAFLTNQAMEDGDPIEKIVVQNTILQWAFMDSNTPQINVWGRELVVHDTPLNKRLFSFKESDPIIAYHNTWDKAPSFASMRTEFYIPGEDKYISRSLDMSKHDEWKAFYEFTKERGNLIYDAASRNMNKVDQEYRDAMEKAAEEATKQAKITIQRRIDEGDLIIEPKIK